MVDGLQPGGDEATLARRAADRDPRAVAQRFFRVIEFVSGGSTPRIREDIIKLPPTLVVQLSRATRTFELTVMPRAIPITEEEFFDDLGVIPGEEVAVTETLPETEPIELPEIVPEPTIEEEVPEVAEPTPELIVEPAIELDEPVDEPVVPIVAPQVVFESDGTSALEIGAKTVLNNIFGDVSDLYLTVADAAVIATFLVEKMGKSSKHPWADILTERFQDVPVEAIAEKYNFTSAQNFRVAMSIFLVDIKQRSSQSLKAELILRLSPRTITPIVNQSKPERKASLKKAEIEKAPEEDMMSTFARVLDLNEKQQSALNYFLGLDEQTPAVQRNEVMEVVNILRLKIQETFTTLNNPVLGLNQEQRRTLYPTLGWYKQGNSDIVRFQDPKYVRNYAMGRQNIDIDLLDHTHTAYKLIAKALAA
ncbi:MAG: hypothetical protein JWM52_454 [Candidatus Saccharibacteria bacterium]|nr:hypothetical protein [Candidatus Saccharibacteria bacterium]